MMIPKMYRLEDIRAAAMGVLQRISEDPDFMGYFRGMSLLIEELAGEPEDEPAPETEPEKKAPKKPQEKKSRNGPVQTVQPGKFMGAAAPMKRAAWEKMMNLKTMEGKTNTEISEMTGGKVTPDEIRAMCGTKKVPLTKWEALAKALGVAV